MRLLKRLILLLILLAALVVGGGYLLSPKFSVSRTVQIQAPPAAVYPLVADPRAWKAWSVWNLRDPSMQMSYSGPPSGAGAAWAWKSESQGNGRMTFTSAEPNAQLDYDLFFDDFGTRSTGTLRFEAQGGGTRVTWLMNGDMGSSPLMRWFALFGDRMIGGDFEAGLANLKVQAERR